MARPQTATGVVHSVPDDLRQLLVNDSAMLERWQDITPLARNEFICWIENAVKPETRLKRMRRTQEDLKSGKRRPCCWPGCPHRVKGGTATKPTKPGGRTK